MERIKATEAELEILNILWKLGKGTVKEIHEQLSVIKETGYTTTLKLLQNMNEKQLVCRDDSAKTHIYQPNVKQELVQRQAVRRILDTLFDGSAAQLVMQALGNHHATESELEQIKIYLEQQKEAARKRS